MRTVWRWGLAFVAADFLTGTTAFVVILLGAVGLAFYTGMVQGLTSVAVGGPIEVLVGVAVIGTVLLAERGYRSILAYARGVRAGAGVAT